MSDVGASHSNKEDVMNFILTMPSPCARALVLMASLCLVVNCHKPAPPSQLDNRDAVVTNANTDNSNSNKNAREVTAEAPPTEQTTKPNASSPRPHVSATPTPLQEFASRDNDDEKTGVVENTNTDFARRRTVPPERAAQQERATRRAARARPKQAATP